LEGDDPVLFLAVSHSRLAPQELVISKIEEVSQFSRTQEVYSDSLLTLEKSFSSMISYNRVKNFDSLKPMS